MNLMSLGNYAANLLMGFPVQSHAFPAASSPLNDAVNELRRRGHSVSPADIPGLWDVSGHPELTSGQLLSLAFPSPPSVPGE